MLTFPGLTAFVLSIILASMSALYFLSATLYTFFSVHTFSERSILSHILSSSIVMILSTTLAFSLEFSRQVLFNNMAIFIMIFLLMLWLTLTWFLGGSKELYFLIKVLVGLSICVGFYFILT